MKILRTVYFFLCFTVICIFFYFFCIREHHDANNSIHTPMPDKLGYPSIVAYSGDNRELSQDSCQIEPKYISELVNPKNEFWQTVEGSGIFLYGTHVDHRPQNDMKYHIRILAMSKGTITVPLYCQLWDETNKRTRVFKLQQDAIWIHSWDNAKSSQYYRPYLFSCPVPRSLSKLGTVSIVTNKCQNPRNGFTINEDLEQQTDRLLKNDFAVCLKPLDYKNDVSLRLLEWLEFQYLLGADKIATYIYRVHPNITKVLKFYEGQGKLTIKLHLLPGTEPNEPEERTEFFKNNIWQKRRHELIPYNDCLYEHMDSHKFVVNLDLDEAIVPMMHLSWSQLLSHVFSDHKEALNSYSSLSVANVYFFDQFGEQDDKSLPPYMHMLRHVYRSSNFSSPGFAVKSFHSTNNTLAVFNHYTLIPLFANIRRNALIGRHLAQLHHYRATCPDLMEKECKTNYMKFSEKDTTIWRFKDQLTKNVKKVARELNLINSL